MRTECAILALAGLEIAAMLTGNDGAYFMPIVGIIAGLGGYSLRPKIEAVKEIIADRLST
jgi:hypothetical protein